MRWSRANAHGHVQVLWKPRSLIRPFHPPWASERDLRQDGSQRRGWHRLRCLGCLGSMSCLGRHLGRLNCVSGVGSMSLCSLGSMRSLGGKGDWRSLSSLCQRDC